MLSTLELLRELFNGALEHRRGAWEKAGVCISGWDQMREVTEVRAARPEFASIHTHLLRDVLLRLDPALTFPFISGLIRITTEADHADGP